LIAEAVVAPALLPRQPCILLIPLQLFLLEGLHPRQNLLDPVVTILLHSKLALVNPYLIDQSAVEDSRLRPQDRLISAIVGRYLHAQNALRFVQCHRHQVFELGRKIRWETAGWNRNKGGRTVVLTI